jgi:hypothetical protein
VDLAYDTLVFLEKVKPSSEKLTDFRSLTVNICDFQVKQSDRERDAIARAFCVGLVCCLRAVSIRLIFVKLQARFAEPMELPFGADQDMTARLPTPQPSSLLKKHGVIYECPADCVAEDASAMFVENGITYCYVGGDSWDQVCWFAAAHFDHDVVNWVW